jgi:hypothetical protein
MVLDDRRAGHALLALGAAGLLAFLALFLLRAPAHAPAPAGTATAAGPAPPSGKPVPPAPPPSLPPPPGIGKRMEFVLHGTVRGPDGKTAVPGAVVEIVPRAGRHEHLVADGKGAFAWTSKDPTPAAVAWAYAPAVGLGHVFVQGAPGTSQDLDLVLAPFRPQPVGVRFGEFGPVRAARVEAFLNGTDAPRLLGVLGGKVTDMKGLCTLDVPQGIPLRFRARWPVGSREREKAVDSAPGPEATVSFVFEPRSPDGRGGVRGTLLDPEGKPLGGIPLTGLGTWSPSMANAGVGAESRPDGTFELSGGWEGEWWVRLRPRASGDWIHSNNATVPTSAEARIRAVRSGGVRVQPVRAEAPGEGPEIGQATLYVLAFVPEGATEADDSWAGSGLGVLQETLFLPPGAWSFLLLAPGRVRAPIEETRVRSGETADLGQIPLSLGGRVSGRVSTPDGSLPRVVLWFLPIGEDGRPRPNERVSLRPRADGSFESEPEMPAGCGWLMAACEGLAPAVRVLANVAAGTTADGGELCLAVGGSVLLRGPGSGGVRVGRVDGLPCAESIPAKPWRVGPEALDRTVTLDADGACLVRHLPAGDYRARLAGPGGETRAFTVKEDAVAVVDFAGR